jgi:hypothetical protein
MHPLNRLPSGCGFAKGLQSDNPPKGQKSESAGNKLTPKSRVGWIGNSFDQIAPVPEAAQAGGTRKL